MSLERLDKIVAAAAGLSRSAARRAILRGKVGVGSKTVRSIEEKFDPLQIEICYEGQMYRYEEKLYLMLYKPAGLLSATRDDRQETVLDLLPEQLRKRCLFPVGRLDKDTTGLLLLTNDGAFSHQITAPGKHIPKVYHVCLDQPVGPRETAAFQKGLTLKDGTRLMPAQMRCLDRTGLLAEVTIRQGRYHQIKRMFGAFGCGVVSLHRVSIGSLALDPALEPGGWRRLTREERALFGF